MQIFSSNGYFSKPVQPKFGIKPSTVELGPMMPLRRKLSDSHILEVQNWISEVYVPEVPDKYRSNKEIARLARKDRIERKTRENGQYFVSKSLVSG
jgi:hypothetical protein